MLTRLTIENFKRFTRVEIELGSRVVFIGPNNCGKTTALQALALWDLGLHRWNEKRKGKETPEKRPGVTINRQDLVSVPSPSSKLLWRDLHIRELSRENGRQLTENIRIDIIVEGVSQGTAWRCGFEFDYANEESFYCRPLRLSPGKNPERMVVPAEAAGTQVSFLPPMSGLADREFQMQSGQMDFLIGQGRTAEVLRNLAFRLHDRGNGWSDVQERIKRLFGVSLEPPKYVPERSEIIMSYRDRGTTLDLSSAGRGLHQTLLLFSYLGVNPGAVLLLDEPDAHLEILRQRQIYQELTDVAESQGSQLIMASHSEVVLEEAADRDVVVAFVGSPHRIDDRGSQVLKSLKAIGFDQYYLADLKGWVLYLEGSTDLAILRSFAETLEHSALEHLQRPFVHFVANQPPKAKEHFYGLREAKPDLTGFLLTDRLPQEPEFGPGMDFYMWRRNEIENYLCQPETLIRYAEQLGSELGEGPLFEQAGIAHRREAMQGAIDDLVPPVALRDHSDAWWHDVKSSDQFLDRLFVQFFREIGLPNLMRKTDYHVLARHVPRERVDDEVRQVLDMIALVASKAVPGDERSSS